MADEISEIDTGLDEDLEEGESVEEDFEEEEVLDDEDLDPEEEKPEAEEPVAKPAKSDKKKAKRTKGDEVDEEEEDDDYDEDDVEEDLDEILKARLASEDDEAAEDDEEDTEVVKPLTKDDRSGGRNRVQPKRPEEFVCQSCFLVKHPSQLADPKHQLCADCV